MRKYGSYIKIEWERATSQNGSVSGAEDFVDLRLVEVRRGGELAMEVHVATLYGKTIIMQKTYCKEWKAIVSVTCN